MNVIRWLTRIEYSLCAIGFFLLLAALAADLAARGGYFWSGSGSVASLGVVLIGLFGMGPALLGPASSLSTKLLTKTGDWRRPASWLRPVAHACTALLFFILFCLEAFVASETRILGGQLNGLGWPLWVAQSLMVLAFGGNVVRFSIYAADPSALVSAD